MRSGHHPRVQGWSAEVDDVQVIDISASSWRAPYGRRYLDLLHAVGYAALYSRPSCKVNRHRNCAKDSTCLPSWFAPRQVAEVHTGKVPPQPGCHHVANRVSA